MERASRVVPVVVAIAVFALVVERAWTWPLGHDEALTWQWFVRRPWSVSFTTYDANHHVLFTLLAKIARAMFGDSEWALRLPSTVAAAAFLAAAVALTRVMALGWWCAAGVVLLAAATHTSADFLVAARGYAGALAGSFIALVALGAWAPPDSRAGRRARTIVIGVALGVTIAFNLSFTYAVAGIVLAAFALRVLDARAFAGVSAIAIGVAVAICGVPLAHATRGAFYFGASTWGELADSLYADTLRQDGGGWLLAVLTAGDPSGSFEAVRIACRVGLALAAIAIVVDLVRGRRARADGDVTRVPGLALCIGLGLAALQHALLDVPLPKGRTALWIVALLPFALARVLTGAGWPRRGGRLGIGIVGFAALLTTLPAPYFAEWAADRSARRMVTAIEMDLRARGELSAPTPVRVCADWRLAPSLTYYAARRRAAPPIDVVRINLREPRAADASPPDYWVVLQDSAGAKVIGPAASVVGTIGWTILLRER